MTQILLSISLTILAAIIADNLLRSFIKIPKSLDSRRSQTYATILRNITTIAVYAVAVYIIFVQLGINITPLLASAGIVGVIIGLGAKTLIEDLISGLFLLTQDSLAIGDHVKIDDSEGVIEKISFRTLTIRSGNGAIHTIPNGLIKKVVNFSRHRTKYPVEIPVKADQSIETVLKAAKNALTTLEEEKDLKEVLLPGSTIDGIEDFKTEGYMVVKATLISNYEDRIITARRFRYLLKKEFEKYKIHFN